jgi:hypothetical protein
MSVRRAKLAGLIASGLIVAGLGATPVLAGVPRPAPAPSPSGADDIASVPKRLIAKETYFCQDPDGTLHQVGVLTLCASYQAKIECSEDPKQQQSICKPI